jgi:hypothetical protein
MRAVGGDIAYVFKVAPCEILHNHSNALGDSLNVF